jgi:hypothetical protein
MDITPYTPNFIQASNPGDCIAIKNFNGFRVTKYNCGQVYGKFNIYN